MVVSEISSGQREPLAETRANGAAVLEPSDNIQQEFSKDIPEPEPSEEVDEAPPFDVPVHVESAKESQAPGPENAFDVMKRASREKRKGVVPAAKAAAIKGTKVKAKKLTKKAPKNQKLEQSSVLGDKAGYRPPSVPNK